MRRPDIDPDACPNAMNMPLIRWTAAALASLALLATGCSQNGATPGQLDGSFQGPDRAGAACGVAAPGCACGAPGELATCKVFELHSGNYTTCLAGTMVCDEGVWGTCQRPASVQKLLLSTGASKVQDLGMPTGCVADPCDPSTTVSDDAGGVTYGGCNQVVDTPDGLDAGSNFEITEAGLTPTPNLTSEAGIACTGLAVNPPAIDLVITGFSPMIVSTPPTANFTATYVPSTCYAGVANAAWSVDRRDLAAITGGIVTPVSGVAGTLNVSAYAAGFQAAAVVNVTTNVLDTSKAPAGAAAQFVGNGTAPDNIKYLYPYANTVFPRSVAAPVVQWDNLGVAATAVKVTIQYPATGTPIFTVSEILPESTPPQAALSQDGWAYLDQTAAGQDALITIQRLVGGTLRNPVSRTIHFATTPLRGNIFYTEYNIPDITTTAGQTATIKSAKPFGTNAAQVALPGANCNPCHSVSANGTTLITSNWGANDTSVARVNGDGTLTGLANMTNQPGAQDSRGFAYSAISPDGTLALQGTNWWGNTLEPGGTVLKGSAPHGNGSGLTGAYYANTTQTGSPVVTETDSTVDFKWGNNSPGGSIAAGSQYSIVWTGYVQAIYNQTYTFEIESSDGAQLTVNGTVIIDHLGAQTDTKSTGTIALTAGAKTPIKLVFQNLSNNAEVHLRWQSASQPYQIVPLTQLYPSAVATVTGLTGSYYANVLNGFTFDSTAQGPTATRLDPTVNFSWNGAAPITGVAGVNFGAAWNGQLVIPCTGNYKLCVTGDDGVRLWVDGTLIDNGWFLQGATTYCPGNTTYTAGSVHSIRMDYFQAGGGAVAQLSWQPPGSCGSNGIIPSADLIPAVAVPPPTNGLTGTYYSNIDFTGTGVTEIDPTVNFNWNGSSPASNSGGSNFSAEWTGQVQIPCTDNYKFCVTGDDGVRLWIDGTLIDDAWVSQGPTTYCNSVSGGTLAETAGTKHDVKMDYFQGGGGSVAQLQWSAACIGPMQVIPQADLFPTGDLGTGGYNVAFHNPGDLGTGVGYSIFEVPTVVGGTPLDVTGPNSWGLGTTAMMVPTFSPDGSKLVFVDGDTTGGASWRQGLSFFSFDQAKQTFGNRTNFVNTLATSQVIRWPAVETDSRSVIYQTNPTSQDDIQSYAQYGGMLPSGYSSIPGQLWSADSSMASAPVSLAQINAGLGGVDSNPELPGDRAPRAGGRLSLGGLPARSAIRQDAERARARRRGHDAALGRRGRRRREQRHRPEPPALLAAQPGARRRHRPYPERARLLGARRVPTVAHQSESAERDDSRLQLDAAGHLGRAQRPGHCGHCHGVTRRDHGQGRRR